MAREDKEWNTQPISNSKDNICLLEAINSTMPSPERATQADTQNKNFKIAITYMFKDLKDDINEFISEIYESTNKQ